jgi:putative methanogenesis marker protein 8
MEDIHVVRYFSSLITISNGKVAKVTKPTISYCPLAHFLYGGIKDSASLSTAQLKDEIKKAIEEKITRYGFCTKDRMLWKDEAVIPYGASEILAHGLKSKAIDSVVTVCDGAGTVITAIPQVVQGIGARMHTMLKTSHIPEVAIKLRRYGCHVLDEKGLINQTAGVAEAAKKGYKKVAVTVNAFGEESLENARALEGRFGISLAILVVCTTGIKEGRLNEIEKYADIVWSCNSNDIRDRLGKKALEVLSNVSPVYVLTENGKRLVSGYSPNIFGLRKEIERSVVS